jgi:hypothetical protein
MVIVRCVEEVDPSGQTFRYPESIKYDQHLKDWSVINLALLEYYYTIAFRIARDWHYRIEGAVEHASQNGTLAPAYKRPPDKNAFAMKWHLFLHLIKTNGLRIKARLKPKLRP